MVQNVTDAQGQAHQFPDEATPAMIAGALGVQTPAPPQEPYHGAILPVSTDAQGNASFDINAGIPGAFLRAFSAPGEVYKGTLDPLSQEGQSRALETAAMFNPMNPAIRAGDRAIPGLARSTNRAAPPTPSASELRTAASGAYDATRATGAEYPAQGISDMAAKTQQSLNDVGMLDILAPNTHAILGKLQNPPAGAVVTISSLDAARKALNEVAGNFKNPTEQRAANRAIRAIDRHIEDAGASAPTPPAGTGQSLSLPAPIGEAGAADGAGIAGAAEDPLVKAARLIREARANSAAAFRSDRVTDAEDAAANRAAATYSGKNGGNATRQRLASLLNSDKGTRGFSPDEVDALQQVVRGTLGSNTLRRAGNMLGGGGGIGQSAVTSMGAGVGYLLGHGEGAAIGAAALPAIGSAARSAYNSTVEKQAAALAELLRQRSPLYQGRQGGLLADPADRFTGLLGRGLLGAGGPREGLPQAPDYRP